MKQKSIVSLEQILMDGIQDMVFVLDVKGNEFTYHFLNRAAMKRTGLTNDVIGKTISEVYPNDTGDFMKKHYMKVVESEEIIEYEDSFNDHSGAKRFSQTTLTPFFDDRNVMTNIVAVVKDITEKKKAEFREKVAERKLEETIERYQSLYHYNLDAVATIDLDGKILTGNEYMEKMTGFSNEELIGRYFSALIETSYFEKTNDMFEKALLGDWEQFQSAIYDQQGKVIKVILKFTPIFVKGKIKGLFAVLKDITELEKTIKKLQESEETFRIITENAHELITLLNDQGKIIYASPSYEDILEINPNEYIGELFLYNVHPEDRIRLDQSIITSIREGNPCKEQFRQKHTTKGWIWCELSGTPVFDKEGQFVNMVVLTRDITLQKSYEDSLKHFANHDTLTGLPNRRYFSQKLRKAMVNHVKNQEGLAVMMLDIDDFKGINDQFGHDVGDDTVIEFSNRLQGAIRETDIAARLGGDEFVVLLNDITSEEEAEKVARKVHEAMNGVWQVKNAELSITTSIGIAIAPEKGSTRSTIMKQADNALYEAKNAGKNCVKILK